MNAWYTIFIDLDQSFVAGLTQVLYSMCVIEVSKPGLEATTYELIITVGNACGTLGSIVATQLLLPLDCLGCFEEPCDGATTVDISSKDTFFATDGPSRFTRYCIVITVISVSSTFFFIYFLPRSKEMCHEWKKKGEKMGANFLRGCISLILSVVIIVYGFTVAILLLDPASSCLPAVGGTGCHHQS